MFINNKSGFKFLKKYLRKNSTKAEQEIWNILRNRKMANQKFFRQFAVGNFILDFYCPKIKLAIEIDGGQHSADPNREKDNQRTVFLNDFGIKVIRFWNNDVLTNKEGVYEEINKKRHELLPASSLKKEEE